MPGADREGTGVVSFATLAFLVAVLAHRRTVTYWFTASDTVPMIESSRVTGIGDLVAILTEPMMAGTRFVEFALFYRPLSSLSYAADYLLWGLDPTGYHLTTILLHGVAAGVATIAIYVVTRRQHAGAIGGLLFAGHPITAEVVPSAVRRHDVLLTIFLLAGLVLFVRSRREVGGSRREAGRSRRELGESRCEAGRSRRTVEGNRREGGERRREGGVSRWVSTRGRRVSGKIRREVDGILRARDGRPALVGSLACYVLALLSKEPALVFPGVVVAWVALGWDRPWSRDALSDALRSVAPFLVVTAAVLGIRFAVLGGLGGYKRNPVPSPVEVLLILVEYPLSLVYPHAVVGMGTLPDAPSEWRVVLVVLAAVGVGVLAAVVATVRRRGLAIPTVAGLVTAGALVAVPLAIAIEPWLVRTVPIVYDPDRLSVVQVYLRPSSFLVGLLLAVAVVAVTVWAATDRDSSLRPGDRRALSFFGLWLIGPVVLFFPAGNYTFRSGYASLVPAMGAVGILLAVGLAGLRDVADRTLAGSPWRRVPAADVALVGVGLLVVLPLVTTSPLVHHYEGWAASGRVNEATLTGVEAATDGPPPEASVEVEGLLRFVGNRGCTFPQAKNLQFARPGTVESWLRLHGEDRRVASRDDRILREYPDRVWVSSGSNGSNVTVTVHYGGTNPESCVGSPWSRY